MNKMNIAMGLYEQGECCNVMVRRVGMSKMSRAAPWLNKMNICNGMYEQDECCNVMVAMDWMSEMSHAVSSSHWFRV